MTAQEKLEQLVAKWRIRVSVSPYPKRRAMAECADELEALLRSYREYLPGQQPPQRAYRECMDIRCMVDTPHDEH